MIDQINVNKYVSVRLTDEGEKVLKDYFEGVVRRSSRRQSTVTAETLIQQSARGDGTRRFQLSELMYIFGSSMYVGAEQMFVQNRIYFD